MKQDKNIKPFDNLLMAYLTNSSQGNYIMESSSKEAEIGRQTSGANVRCRKGNNPDPQLRSLSNG